MPIPAQKIRVFLSSPSDVLQERSMAMEVLDHLPYDPFLRDQNISIEVVAWDKASGTPLLATMTPQDAINQGLPRPSECDIVVVILWTRIGTPLSYPEYQKPNGTPYESGTEWEYLNAMQAAQQSAERHDKPVLPQILVYRRTTQVLLDDKSPNYPTQLEQEQGVNAFFEGFIDSKGAFRHGYNTYETCEQFQAMFEQHIKILIKGLIDGAKPAVSAKAPHKSVETPARKRTGQISRIWLLAAGLIVIALVGVMLAATRGIANTLGGNTSTATSNTSATQPANPATATMVNPSNTLISPPPISGKVIALAYSPDGKTLASDGCDTLDSNKSCSSNDFRLWDVATGKLIVSPIKDQVGYIYCLAYSPDGKWIATGGEDQTIHLRDAATGKTLNILKGHTNNVMGLAFSPDNKLLASASADRTVRLWDVVTDQPVGQPIKGATDWLRTIVFSPDGKVLAYAGDDKVIRLWDMNGSKPFGQPLIGHSNTINILAFSHNGAFLASAGFDHTAKLWDIEKGSQIKLFNGFTGWLLTIAISPDNNTLAVGGCAKQVSTGDNHFICNQGDLQLFNLSTNTSQTLADHTSWTESIAFSPDGKFLASGSADKTINIWNLQDDPPSQAVWPR